jgi:TetR/AcrR family fatty acid metabolism transcriptional regulator
MRSQKTKEKIVQAAIKVFSENGYERSYVEDILKEANVCKGTFYRYFRSKKDLLEHACQDFLFNVGGEWYEFITETDDPVKGLENHVDFVCTLVYEEKTATTYFELWARGVRSEASRRSRSQSSRKERRELPGAGIYRRLRENISHFYQMGKDRGIFRRDIDPKLAASLMIGAVDGISTQYLLEPNAVDLLKARDLIKQTYIYDLIVPEAE